MMRAGLMLTGAIALLLAAMALKGVLIALPVAAARRPATASTPTAPRRGSQRILGDQRPHPVDSAAGDAVRERLIAEMRARRPQPARHRRFRLQRLPAQPQRSPAPGCATWSRRSGRPRGGTCCSSPIMTAPSPGRARPTTASASPRCWRSPRLLRGRPLARPVTFLFNEGEEMGLLGARAFLERDPLGGAGRHR